ncbi:MAG: MFS transporter [Anaerolineaceae bacterium]|nr:MFS transporter [Anaerolineaceae bacterium]
MNLQLSQTFTALKYRNFRLWFSGQMVSLIGTWMQATAQSYLLFELTGSPVMLGIAGFASGIPIWLFSLYSGLISDRFSRRKVILFAQTSMMVLGFILAILTFMDLVQPWHIIVLAFLLGTANAFDAPARQSFVVDMVPKDDLTNAIALNSSVFNLGTIVGPAVAGLIYAWLGPAWCFTINGISFLGVIAALLMMNVPPRKITALKKSPFSDLKDGLRFAVGHVEIRYLLINLAAVAMFSFSLMTLMPDWANTVLKGDVTTNGLLLSARGAGSLAAALMIANLGSRVVRGKIWTFGGLVMPFAIFLLGSIRILPVSIIMLVVLGWSLMSVVNISNALIQTHVPDHLRGRVMSIYILVFMGSYPIGALLVGWLADMYGSPTTMIICGVVIAIVVGTINLLHPNIRKFN